MFAFAAAATADVVVPDDEIVQGSLTGKTEKDEALRQAIASCDLFIRNSGMGQDTNFMEFSRKLGKPYGLFGQSYFSGMVEGKDAEKRIATGHIARANPQWQSFAAGQEALAIFTGQVAAALAAGLWAMWRWVSITT